jgi:hypothetical protein
MFESEQESDRTAGRVHTQAPSKQHLANTRYRLARLRT